MRSNRRQARLEQEGNDMGRVRGRQIDLGTGRRVCRNDLYVLHALVSNNSQTLDDLSRLRPEEQVRVDRQIRYKRSRLGREPLLDRWNGLLFSWVYRGWRATRQGLTDIGQNAFVRTVRGWLHDALDLPAFGRQASSSQANVPSSRGPSAARQSAERSRKPTYGGSRRAA